MRTVLLRMDRASGTTGRRARPVVQRRRSRRPSSDRSRQAEGTAK
jgi:hypothetical protein